MSSIRIQLGAVSSFFRVAPKVIWIGPVFVIAAFGGSVIFFFLWKFGLGMALSPVSEYVSHNLSFRLSVGLSVFLYLGFLTWMASLMWIHVNEVFYRDKARQRIFGKIAELFTCYTHAAALIMGAGAITWLLGVAVVPRIPGNSGHQTLFLSLLVFGLFSPLLVRLFYLPVVGAIEPGEAWRKLQESTAGRGITLLLTVPLQAVLVGCAVWLFMRIVWPWINPIVSAAGTGNYTTVADLAEVISGYWSVDLVLSVACFAFAAGPFLSLISTLQVAVVRSFVASEENSVTLKAATETSELQLDEEDEPMVALNPVDGHLNEGDPLDDLNTSGHNEAEADPLDVF